MQVKDEVLAVLSASSVNGSALHLPPQLDRKLYLDTNKVLEAAGGKWNRKAGAHIFDGAAQDRIDQIILTGDVVVPKDEFEFFPTPPEVAAMVAELADVHGDDRVLEPSAGTGALISAIVDAAGVALRITAIEKNVEMARGLQESFGGALNVICADFMDAFPDAGKCAPNFDAAVMNPPFSRQQDIKHVNHAIKFLRPGGRLVAVMAAGVTFRQDRLATDFRSMVQGLGGIIKPLPEGSFKKSGTGVNTVLVAFDVAG